MVGFLTRDERTVMLFLAAALTVGAIVLCAFKVDPSVEDGAQTAATQVVVSGSPAAPAVIDVNSASAVELENLPGIGPAKAVAIVELREERGSFGSVDELDDVRGIGPATLDRLRPLVTVSAAPGVQPMGSEPEDTVDEREDD